MPSEKRTLVRPIKVELICDCGSSMSVRQQNMIGTNVAYVHVCHGCDESVTLDAPHPRIDHEEIQEGNGYVMLMPAEET